MAVFFQKLGRGLKLFIFMGHLIGKIINMAKWIVIFITTSDFCFILWVKTIITKGTAGLNTKPLVLHICPMTFKTKPFHILTVYQVWFDLDLSNLMCKSSKNVSYQLLNSILVYPCMTDKRIGRTDGCSPNKYSCALQFF